MIQIIRAEDGTKRISVTSPTTLPKSTAPMLNREARRRAMRKPPLFDKVMAFRKEMTEAELIVAPMPVRKSHKYLTGYLSALHASAKVQLEREEKGLVPLDN